MSDNGKWQQNSFADTGGQASFPEANNGFHLRDEVAAGLAYLHARSNATTTRTWEAASFVYALIELLSEKGLVSIDEIDGRKKAVAGRLLKRFIQHDPGVAIQEPEQDKYAFTPTAKIDCENRVHLCKAACCKMVFPLSRQDIEEGVIKWDLGKPYVIAKGADGYCQHFDHQCLGCTVHAQRPIPCRAYDCRNDKRIWLDFENKIVNSELNDPDWPGIKRKT
jgi:Fe-S-cluster containining protein